VSAAPPPCPFTAPPKAVPVDVGWRCSSPQAALAFLPPVPLAEIDPDAARALAPDPFGTGDLGRRILVARAPYNLRLRRTPPGQTPMRFGLVPEPGGLTEAGFRGLVQPIVPTSQRKGGAPAVQISLNLHLVTDEPCSLHLTSPYLSPSFRDWPGTLVSGRFPLRSWPRALNAVLEWQDAHDWVLRRGDPMAYLWLHFDDPGKLPRVVEAALTPALKRHLAQVDNVSTFGRNVAPMFQEAERRRPGRLLTPKRTGCPDFS